MVSVPNGGREQCRQRHQFATAALPSVITMMDAQLPKDMDPKDAAQVIAFTTFEIADAMVKEAGKRG